MQYDYLTSPEDNENTTDISSTESLDVQMNMLPGQQKINDNLIVLSRDDVHFNVYLNSNTYIGSPQYVNKFCRFMDSRTENQVVKLHLGAGVHDMFWIHIGAIISAIIDCKANVITYAGGACGMTESIIWLFGKERTAGHYGQLSFEMGNYKYKIITDHQGYVDFFFDKAKEIGILSEQDVTSIIHENRGVSLFGEEIMRNVAAADNVDDTHPMTNEEPTEVDVPTEQVETPTVDENTDTVEPATEGFHQVVEGDSFSIGIN